MKALTLTFLVLLLLGCGRESSTDRRTYPPGIGPNGMSTEVGAGGSGVYCPGYFEITDVYEARKRGMGPALGPPNLPVPQKIQMALGRLARLSPQRAARYWDRAQFILAKAYYFKKGYIPHIADDDPQDLGEGCVLVTIATRRKPVFRTDPEFLINEQLWSLLDNDNKAALVLHEVVYEEAYKEFGHRSSRYSRAFASQFFSTSIDQLSFPELLEFLDTIDFARTDHGGVQIPTHLRSDNRFRTGTTWIAEQQGVVSVEFGQSIEAALPTQPYVYFGKKLWIGGGYTPSFFFKRGQLRLIYGAIYAELPLADRGNLLYLDSSADSLTFFGDKGNLELVGIGKGSRIRMKDGTTKTIENGPACVFLSEEGLAEILEIGECYKKQADEKKLEIPERLRSKVR